jgi:hypothetical protein
VFISCHLLPHLFILPIHLSTQNPNEGAWSAQLSVKYPFYSQGTQRQFASLDYLKSGILKDYQAKQCTFWDSLSTWGI